MHAKCLAQWVGHRGATVPLTAELLGPLPKAVPLSLQLDEESGEGPNPFSGKEFQVIGVLQGPREGRVELLWTGPSPPKVSCMRP